jgi:hypothetical protein
MPKHRRQQLDACRAAKAPIVLEPSGFMELSEADRREAVAALADLLAAWWERDLNSAQSDGLIE